LKKGALSHLNRVAEKRKDPSARGRFFFFLEKKKGANSRLPILENKKGVLSYLKGAKGQARGCVLHQRGGGRNECSDKRGEDGRKTGPEKETTHCFAFRIAEGERGEEGRRQIIKRGKKPMQGDSPKPEVGPGVGFSKIGKSEHKKGKGKGEGEEGKIISPADKYGLFAIGPS